MNNPENILEKPLWDCLETLVGLSKNDCSCYEDLPDDVNPDLITKSLSGLYIDSDTNLPIAYLLQHSDCSSKGFWAKLIEARRLAIVEVVQQLAVALNSTFESRVDRNVQVGSSHYSGNFVLTPGKQTITIETANLPGGTLHATHMGFLAELPQGISYQMLEIDIKRIGDTNNFAEYDWKIQTVVDWAGRQTPDPDLYPLPENGFELYCDGSTYEISYTYNPVLFTPKDNDLTCSVCLSSQRDIAKFFSRVPSGKAKGLMFNLKFYCNPQYLACALLQNKVIRLLIAEMIQNRTISIWLSKIRSQLGQGTTVGNVLNIGQVDAAMGSYDALFINKLNYLTSEYDIKREYLDCFACKSGNIGSREPILLGSLPVYRDEIGELEAYDD